MLEFWGDLFRCCSILHFFLSVVLFFFGFFDVSQFLLGSSIVMFGTWKRRCFCLVLPFSRKDQPLHVGALATFGMICRTFFFRFPFPTLLCQTVLAMYCLALAVHLMLKKITQQGPRTRNLLFSPLRQLEMCSSQVDLFFFTFLLSKTSKTVTTPIFS